MKNTKFILLFSILLNSFIALPQTAKVSPFWQQQKTEPYRGKQDDIYFLNDTLGWYCNGSGKIYKTYDGGINWKLITEKPGTYFRCLGFADSLTGFAGNIGTDYFPGVTDTVPIYKTTDGGKTWSPVPYKGPTVKGLCAIDIYREPFINAGKRDYKIHIYAGGRVGSPAFMMVSHDGGNSFVSTDMSAYCKYILDIKFFNLKEGIICAGSSEMLENNHALIIGTDDGGKTWTKRYESNRNFEITWKCSFPSRKTGYVTIQNYDTLLSSSPRYVAKTTDGGKTWKELPLVDDIEVAEFGIAFTDDDHGWVGAAPNGFETSDGGKTWKKCYNGVATNKIRVVNTPQGHVSYAIGVYVFKGKDYIEDGYDVIAAMRNHYAGGRWYKNLTFIQDAIFYKEGKVEKTEQWHEALSAPGKLCIKFNGLDSKNGVVFADGKMFSVKEGTLVTQRPFVHDILLTSFDVYFLKVYETTHLLDSMGYNCKVFHQDEFNGRKVFVVGAKKGDESSPQIWIDAENWYVHRLIYKQKDKTYEVVLGDYSMIENNHVAKTVTFKINGQLSMVEKYHDIKFPKELKEEIFDPLKFTDAKW